MTKRVCTGAFIFLFAAAFSLNGAVLSPLGQVISTRVALDGVNVSAGATLLDQSVLTTTQHEAAIHLGEGRMLQLHRNSSAFFEKGPGESVEVSVRAGTLSYLAANGAVVTMPPSSSVTFPTAALPVAGPQQAGLRVVLLEAAAAGQPIIRVNDATRIDPQQLVLLRSPDGSMEELHYVEAFDVDHVRLTANLQKGFGVNTQVIQDSQALSSARAAGLVPVGVAAGVSIGAAAAAAAGATAAGLSTAAITGIVVGAAAATTIGVAAATDSLFFEESSP